MIKAVIFDFDDTIIDNNLMDYRSFIIPSKKLGLKLPSTNKITEFRKKGYLATNIISKFFLNEENKDLIHEFFSIRKNFVQSLDSTKFLRLKKNLRFLLRILKRKQIECYLCTTRQQKEIVYAVLKKNDITKYFGGIFFNENLGIIIDNYNKQNRILIKTSLLHLIMKTRRLQNTEMIYVGNSEEDLLAAKILKIHFIYIQNSYLPNLNEKNTIKVKNVLDLKNKIELLQRGSK